jgi:hypothetical protein
LAGEKTNAAKGAAARPADHGQKGQNFISPIESRKQKLDSMKKTENVKITSDGPEFDTVRSILNVKDDQILIKVEIPEEKQQLAVSDSPERQQLIETIRALIQQYDADLVSSVLEEVAPETETLADQVERRIWDTIDDFGSIPVLKEIIEYTKHVQNKGDDQHRRDAKFTIKGLTNILARIEPFSLCKPKVNG